jgi:hypothetical protein
VPELLFPLARARSSPNRRRSVTTGGIRTFRQWQPFGLGTRFGHTVANGLTVLSTMTIRQKTCGTRHCRGCTAGHQPRPGAAAGVAARAAGRDPRDAVRRGLRPSGEGGGPYRASAGERRQPGHQELHRRNAGLLPGLRPRREALDGRPPLLAGRRRDHVLRRHRDGRVHRPASRPDQGRHGDLRRVGERGLLPRQHRAAVQRVAGVLRPRRDPGGRTALLGLPAGVRTCLPARHRLPLRIRLHP